MFFTPKQENKITVVTKRGRGRPAGKKLSWGNVSGSRVRTHGENDAEAISARKKRKGDLKEI